MSGKNKNLLILSIIVLFVGIIFVTYTTYQLNLYKNQNTFLENMVYKLQNQISYMQKSQNKQNPNKGNNIYDDNFGDISRYIRDVMKNFENNNLDNGFETSLNNEFDTNSGHLNLELNGNSISNGFQYTQSFNINGESVKYSFKQEGDDISGQLICNNSNIILNVSKNLEKLGFTYNNHPDGLYFQGKSKDLNKLINILSQTINSAKGNYIGNSGENKTNNLKDDQQNNSENDNSEGINI